MVLETERLILREFQEGDVEAVYEYGSDAEANKYVSWGPKSEEDAVEFVRKALVDQQEQPRSAFNFAVVTRTDNKLIGRCGISTRGMTVDIPNSKEEAEIGYAINRKYWNQGYVTEAAKRVLQFGFEELGLHRIYASCRAANIASVHVIEKTGMKFEGRLRHYKFARGDRPDSLLYSIFKQEWKGK